jgi:hypothetical protein
LKEKQEKSYKEYNLLKKRYQWFKRKK